MTNPTLRRSIDRSIDAVIELAGCSAEDRILLAGVMEPRRILDWRSRGYHRVATLATCRLPRGQYNVAFVEWRQHSIKALEATLDWLVYFLSRRGVLVIWIDGADVAPLHREIRTMIDRLGFRVETGRRTGNGFTVSARRLHDGQREIAA
jgi:hypothetical protein